jgi:hypothetical protein
MTDATVDDLDHHHAHVLVLEGSGTVSVAASGRIVSCGVTA